MASFDKDSELISMLHENARIPVSEIARRLCVSQTAAQYRLKKLESSGVIKGYTVHLSDKNRHKKIVVNVMIKSPPLKRSKVEQTLAQIHQITGLYSIAGSYDLSATVQADTVNELDNIIDSIGAIDCIEETMSSIILATKFER